MKNKGMKLLSKIVAVCFALILTISMAVPVQAAIGVNERHTITVTGKETDLGATVAVYKIINVNFDYAVQQPKKPTYIWVKEVGAWLKQNGFEAYVGDEALGGYEVSEKFSVDNKELVGTALSKMMSALKQAIVSDQIELGEPETGKIEKEANYQVKFENMEMGQYLILTTSDQSGENANYEYVPATANIVPMYNEESKDWFTSDADVTIKGSPAEIEKDVDDHTVEIGQEVNYKVTVPVPYYPEDATAELFRIGDRLPIGITFGQTYDENKLQVTAVYENGKTKEIGTSKQQNGEVFVLYYNAIDCGKDGIITPFENTEGSAERLTTFLLDFDYDALIEKFGTIKDNGNTFALKSIEVTYTGTINENAILKPDDLGYPEDADPLENKAYVGQNNNPYDWDSYTPSEDKEKVYTYAINVSKVSEDQKPLSGAEFQMFGKAKKLMEFVKMGDGKYRLAKADDTDTTTKLVVSKSEDEKLKGKLELEGLTTGTYYLQETKAPDGYEVLDELIEVQIIDEDEDGVVDNPGDVENDPKTNIVYKTVTNRKPPIMPITGGMGTVIFSVVGIVLVVGGVTLIASYLRRKRA